jgi:3D (Asp-Asp-Asp) domain-containing protein
MKRFYAVIFLLVMASAAYAREQSMLVRVTGYWAQGEGGSGAYAAITSARLHKGHCAVDPKKIPYGSKVVFSDATCEAVDTGPAVVSRKAARLCGRNESQRNALVIDRFFDSRAEAVAWSDAHPQFMEVRILSPGSDSEPKEPITKKVAEENSPPLKSDKSQWSGAAPSAVL